MAGLRNLLLMRRVRSALARNNKSFASFLDDESTVKVNPFSSSIFSKNDFCARRFQTQANMDSQTSKDLENNEASYSKSNCDSVDASLQVDINDNSSVKLSATSNLKTSSRHDLAMIFTCKVCETRSVKTVCRQSYEKGVVVARCGGCNNLHLIADRLGWFGEPGSVEEFLAAKGEEVKKGSVDTLSLTLDDLAGRKITQE
ncbi:hypothetical protein K2173_004107 [Erythroxylum novogranatense]|uniref:DNL-type domain-containing protein n=1 Tax=Erythroxylum novogranatense TaxID=1862640 RepID=A0AAV8SXB2_9ROSI|nr:hypothetical protein K2173_004107 [Erythroxylum novogranatense]